MHPEPVVDCHALHSQPLASYFAALGLLRVVSSQRNGSVRGAFSSTGFKLHGIEESEVVDFLLDDWAPSPVLTPWNNASGFYDSSKGRLASSAMDAVVASGAVRFQSLGNAIGEVKRLVASAGYEIAPDGEDKARFIGSLRNSLSDEAVAWLDAAAAVTDGDARMMPVLGSGGNEGVLDYSGLFLRSIVDTLLGDRSRSERLLRSALFDASTSDLVERPGGQFDPGTAGGFNTGPGFESKDLPNNPWTFLLLVEGTVVWSSGIASRQQGIESGYRFAVSPFTVRHRAAGYGSASSDDDDPQRVRAEVWLPVWRRPVGLSELTRLIGEGRVEVSNRKGESRRAADSMDFVDAVAALSVDRGIDTFVRYTFIKRRGESYIALPTNTVQVAYRREVDLLRQLDRELEELDRFFSRFPGENGPPALLVGLRRAIDEGRFDVAVRGGRAAMTRLVRAIGAMEMALARRDPGKEPKLPRPLGRLSSGWLDACDDTPEVRLAASLASIAGGGAVGPLRAYLAPLDPKDPNHYAPAARTRAWSGADLPDRLANVLQRRLLDCRTQSSDARQRFNNPTWGGRVAELEDVASFLAGESVDDRALEELLFGFTWCKAFDSESVESASSDSVPLPRSYALLKLLFLPYGIPTGTDRVTVNTDPAILSLLRAGRIDAAVVIARRQLGAAGLKPRRVTEKGYVNVTLGRRLAAALLIPTGKTRTLANRALIPTNNDATQPDNYDQQETTDAR